ncbi:MAG: hypothetical protein M3Z04_01875 [Chloroflexota bacterium]|nr:hypothetical protein [Chloroflexota bacterium]
MIMMPVFAMIVGYALAIIILTHYAAAPARRTHELIWGISFWLFGLGAMAAVFGAAVGWHDLLARVYYISGAILAVTYLGLGEAILLWPRMTRVSLIIGALFTLLTLIVLLTAPIDKTLLTTDQPWTAVAPKGKVTLPGILAGVSNTLGTLLIVGGALYSAWVFWRKGIQRQRMIGCILLAVGTLVVASGGTIARTLHEPFFLYPSMALGVSIMFIGYLQTTRVPVAKPLAQPS